MPARIRAVALAAVALIAAPASAALPLAPASAAADCAATVWTAGTGGYSAYRIPAIVKAGTTLIALAEGRRTSAADAGDIEVVERRSTDGGCTWSATQVAADAGRDTIGNPGPVVTATGTLVLLTTGQAGTVTQTQIQAGTVSAADGRRVYVQTSTDAGATWSARREITSTTKQSEWLWYATGPGHGLALVQGPHAGRLVAAADHTGAGALRGMHLLLSDDDGLTWRIGAKDDHIDGIIAPDETTAAELPDGRIYLSSRNQDGNGPARAYTYSANQGEAFTGPEAGLPALITPKVEGSVLQDPGLPAGVSCHPLLYSGPEDPSVRRHLTIRRSDDAGVTWRTVTEITGAADTAAYSDIVKVDRTHLGVLYETTAGTIAYTTATVTCP